MRDKSRSIVLIVFLGISAMAVLMLTWLRPMSGSERVLNTFIGSVVLSITLVRALVLKSQNARTDDKHPAVEVKGRG